MNEINTHDVLFKYFTNNNLPIKEFQNIGVRDSYNMDQDVINDSLGFWNSVTQEVFLSPGTTDPSVYWTKSEKRNPSGTFHLRKGFHENIWCIGKHQNTYEAFVNDWRYCKPTAGWRDADYDFIQDATEIEVKDYFGINFHRMSEFTVIDKIGLYSAGCQVVQNPKSFAYILKAFKNTDMYKKNSKATINYMLFEKDEYAKLFEAPVVELGLQNNFNIFGKIKNTFKLFS